MKTQFHTGAVCYIDLLGFSYLTELLEDEEILNDNSKEKSFGEKQVKELTISDFRTLYTFIKTGHLDVLSVDTEHSLTISEWAYEIVDANLKNFHGIVEKACSNFQNADYMVISDSLFIVSENADDVLFILAAIFRNCIKSGILLRAGLAYGTYYIVNTHLSSFNIYGTAVTKAVKYERLGKGCRIFTDSDFPSSCNIFSENPELFSAYKNYQNYSTLDCFEWLMINDSYVLRQTDLKNLKTSTGFRNAFELLCDNLEVYCALRYSPKYNWNIKTQQGIEHLGVSIEYISALLDKIYGFCFVPQPHDLKEIIEDGQKHAKSQKRSDEVEKGVIERKKIELKKILGIYDNV